jgi:preprotein translocase SecE subunit
MSSEKKPNIFVRIGRAFVQICRAIAKFFRDYGSEMKKVTWAPASTVRKNTIIVAVIVAVFAVGIGILDVAFNLGFTWLGKLI